MTRILIVFGTTDGHTARIASFLGEQLRSRGHADTLNKMPTAFVSVCRFISYHFPQLLLENRRWRRQRHGSSHLHQLMTVHTAGHQARIGC